ncbi:cytochrome c-550 PedF [Cupriavidus sp. USMAHM13]|nr:cytochrome c-550 PedF [Cupriavidus sp. USMAHM13]
MGMLAMTLWLALAALALFVLTIGCAAAEVAHAPVVDASRLPPLGTEWRTENPYRGNAEAEAVGRTVFNQSCARCHGADAAGGGSAPDLRRLDGFCRAIGDAKLRHDCMVDNDVFFRDSVLHGKVRVGVVHMPPWEGLLPQEVLWAVQAFVESQRGK